MGHVITFVLAMTVSMYMEGERERAYGGKQSHVEQKEEEGDGRGTTK